jgi:hypothetical protein
MLHMSGVQMEAAALLRFERRIIDVLAAEDRTARAVLDTREGRLGIRQQIERAQAYGLFTELEVARYLITAWLLGPDFDRRFPAMQELLETVALTPAAKAEALERVTVTLLNGLAEGR